MLERIVRLPRTGVFLGALVIVLVGFFAPGWYGAIVLLALAAGLGWLLTVTWPRHRPADLVIRLLVLTVLVVAAVLKVT